MLKVRFLTLVFLLSVGVSTYRAQNTPPPPIANGYVAGPDRYKWVVGVHRRLADEEDFEQICGGSLISTEVVLSAAHCFWNSGNAVPVEQYIISAGNFHRDMETDQSAQKREVKAVIFHERYRGYELNYAHDIIIVQLKKKVILNNLISPVMVDWSYSFDDLELKGQVGMVVGWGFTEYDEPSTVRVAAALPYVDFSTCWKTVPREFRSSITPDKFCAGLRNGTAVCPGDSGSGLAFLNPTDMQWYLRGIVSVGVVPKDSSRCQITEFSAFTSISNYRFWLEKNLRSSNLMPGSTSEPAKEIDDSDVIIFS